MATPTPKRPLSTATNTPPRSWQVENNPNKPLSSTPPSSGQGLARTASIRSGRPVRRVPGRGSIASETGADEDDSKEQNAQLIADLKEQVERAEQASEQYRRQLESLQKRLDEAMDEQTAAEERDFAHRTEVDKLRAEVKESARQRRELEVNIESERKLLEQDQERQGVREAELQTTVNRLTESLKMKSLERASTVRYENMADNEERTPIDNSGVNADFMQLIQEKDSMIDVLKLELADIHLKFAEQEHMGDGRTHHLEKALQDIKMQNARLVEENDSFQMLLSEKTLKGDFMHDHHADTSGMSSLADELESIGEQEEVPAEQYRKVETELRTIKEEKKALTLYIDKIIGRLLQHEGFEHIITGKEDDDEVSSAPRSRPSSSNKPLPAPPAPVTTASSAPIAAPLASPGMPPPDQSASSMTFLQRARSVVARNAPARARPMSFMQATPSANENPQTAPSIPLKGHRRIRSEQDPDLGGAALVQQMNRGSPMRTASGNPISPGLSPLQRAQTSYFAPVPPPAGRPPSQAGTAEHSSSANSVVSDVSLEQRDSTENSSTRPSTHGKESTQTEKLPGAVMKQNQLRPLRLVQEQTAADEEAAKKAKRGSWMGWFNQGSVEAQHQ